MIVSHEWLREFVPHEYDAASLGELLSRHVVTLDGLEPLRRDLASFVVGEVVEASPHPDSDHLSVTKVDDGSGTLWDVVCGAPNVTAGHKYPFARTGTTMPGGLVIAKRKIRGAVSNGMLCSAKELGLGEEHDGIYRLETDAPAGTPLLDVLPVGDVRLELDVLPNRPDLLSHVGVAREVSAITGVARRMPDELPPLPDQASVGESVLGESEATADGVTVRLADRDACPRYIAVVVRGVRVGPSPEWLVERLHAVGARSVNNVVDVTNYVLHGLGQPVHAFDLRKLSGARLEVRATREGEGLRTLDDVDRKLVAGTTVVCDGTGPAALAGIMGGAESEVGDETTDVVLEVAWFDPRFVRRVRRMVQLSTDASYRFERGVDSGFTGKAAGYAASLLTSVAGGKITAVIDVGTARPAPPAVPLRASRVAHLLGTTVSAEVIANTLTALGCTVNSTGEGEWSVAPPTWRHDLGLEVDLIEEVARLVGFDTLPDTLRAFRPSAVPDHPLHVVSRRVRDRCVAAGLAETRPMPFVATASDESLRVRNPLAEDEPYLRASILTTLGSRVEYNLSRMQGDVRLFEIGATFTPREGRLPLEELRVGAVITGASRPPHFTEPEPPPYDEWDAKALAESLAKAAYPGQRVTLAAGSGQTLWTAHIAERAAPIGRVERLTLDRPVWASATFGVELTLGVMQSADVAPAGEHAHAAAGAVKAGALLRHAPLRHAPVRYAPLAQFPATTFDLALLVPHDLPAHDVEIALRAGAGELLDQLFLFDHFDGHGVPEGFRSLAWRLTLRHPERTLREKEIDGRRRRLLQILERELGVKPRSA